MRTSPAALAAFALAFVVAVPAHACWDGFAASIGETSVMSAGDATFSPTLARDVARWLTRVNALLPAGLSVASEHGFVSFSCDASAKGCVAPDDARWSNRSIAGLFPVVAAAVKATPATVKSAAARDARVLTVQVGAFRDAKLATAFAERLEELHRDGKLTQRGFLDVGGFPNVNPIVHVVPAVVGGDRVHDVVVDVFVDPADAETTRDEIARVAGTTGFVRSL